MQAEEYLVRAFVSNLRLERSHQIQTQKVANVAYSPLQPEWSVVLKIASCMLYIFCNLHICILCILNLFIYMLRAYYLVYSAYYFYT
jgi:hypothetical protein